MDRQFNQLAGVPIGSLVGPEACAYSSISIGDAKGNIAIVATLLDAFAAVLTAEESLLGAAFQAPANGVRCAIEAIRSAVREVIETTIAAPGDAFERVALLGHAVDLEGADGPLVTKCALALAAIGPSAG